MAPFIFSVFSLSFFFINRKRRKRSKLCYPPHSIRVLLELFVFPCHVPLWLSMLRHTPCAVQVREGCTHKHTGTFTNNNTFLAHEKEKNINKVKKEQRRKERGKRKKEATRTVRQSERVLRAREKERNVPLCKEQRIRKSQHWHPLSMSGGAARVETAQNALPSLLQLTHSPLPLSSSSSSHDAAASRLTREVRRREIF